jgi:hypothetical protein
MSKSIVSENKGRKGMQKFKRWKKIKGFVTYLLLTYIWLLECLDGHVMLSHT